MGKKFVFLLISLISVWMANAQNTTIKGIVTDSITGEALPYVSLIFKGTTLGTATDGDGCFSFSAPATGRILQVSYLGYDTKEVKIIQGKTNDLKIQLAPNGITLNEVVIKPKKEKYSKKENPAVEFVKQVIALRERNNPRNHDYFQYDQYEKMIFAMNDYQPKPKKNGKTGKFDFLVDFIDTLDIGTTILPVSEKEKVETVYYRKNPKSEKHVVKGNKSSGVDEVFSRDGIQQVLNEVFREVDIFKNDVPLFLQRFVSPLSTIGPNYYKYYLLDTLDINGQECVDLGFVPFNSETFGFTGHLYVTLDSTFFVQKAILNVPKDINLNFVSRMTIEQIFERTPEGTRVITKDDISVNFKLNEKTKGMYARRLNIYSNQSFEELDAEQAWVFKENAPVITLKEAYRQPEDFWASNRPEEAVKKNPNSVKNLMAKLRSVPVFYVTEKVVTTLVSGYIDTNKDPLKSKFEFGPMNTTISGNSIEGARFRVGGTTTPAFNKNLFFDGYVAYGTKDEKLKYNALVEYSFNDRKEFRKEFPMNSIRFEYMYDINKLGQQYMYTSKDNILLTIRRQKDTRATYLRQAELTYSYEHYNGLSYNAIVRNRREYATEYAVFDRIGTDGTISRLGHYDMTELELKIRYARNEKFYQTRNNRIPITYDALIFNFSHVMAKKDLLGSAYDYHRTDIGIQKRLWFSAFGYMDIITKAGKVWTKVPYPLLILPNANLSYTIQPEAYTNMNAMEFINDEYASWDLTYYMNGNLLNRLPLIKKLKAREVFAFRGLWGHLTDKNNPANGKDGLYLFPYGSYTLGKAPYMEASVGIENIFQFLRLDYVWRLNYRDHPGIQTKGVRCTMRLSF
ncbi:DUF5686 and carboxypeptidase regulatory-like domain-containing protein [Parabacteroides faecis]|uniref:DUF5686 and carboxypeptidase-like regulatory domain-containing protein n=1 Tax=Parabacteroides faecis TaxID=1217282 RepID=UPI0021649A8F|nr:DUF5686 and carboxypeptidase-like regulatory domain-containing protein [Parabacteroides faecis]MCS2893590.1 DUF5686 and carboxypeptidase regulatory-like domain-containing protein [Parabacteroides faecis]UVQ47812.1 DUF5686 and carboxypeptidase regulatory-like domain-containing protein [Parabacteroides faecis]